MGEALVLRRNISHIKQGAFPGCVSPPRFRLRGEKLIVQNENLVVIKLPCEVTTNIDREISVG